MKITCIRIPGLKLTKSGKLEPKPKYHNVSQRIAAKKSKKMKFTKAAK